MDDPQYFPSELKQLERSGESHQPADWMFLQPAIMDRMHESVITSDLAGMITGSNRASCRIFGYSAEELRGRHVSLLYPEEDLERFERVVKPLVMTSGGFDGELRNRTKSGDYLYVHLSVVLLRDGDGEPVGMVGFSVDVTSQKLGDLALKHGEGLELRLEEQTQSIGFMKTLMRAVERSNDVIMICEAER